MEKDAQGEKDAVKRLLSATLEGIDAQPVEVEVSFIKGLPAFGIVGLGSTAIQESKERVKSALNAAGFSFPPLKITVNLSPSDLQKSGSHFDLPIALAITLHDTPHETDDLYIFGELGLDGTLKESAALFPLLLSLANRGLLRRAMVPADALARLSLIPDITLIGVQNLTEAIAAAKGEYRPPHQNTATLPGKTITVGQKTYHYLDEYPEDFAQVIGQERAKRAALIAAAGMHNLLMEGSPGCGKSMIARRLRYILPPMSREEVLQATRYALLGDENPNFRPLRPFRAPHHSASKPSIFGGGSTRARIGEVALANGGILFFDEFPHFQKSVLEALREPLQDHRLLISRVNAKVSYETRFLFVAAQNPCPCGNLLSARRTCRCTELEIKRYKNRLSDPLLDRIELYVQMQESSESDRASLTSAQMHRQVIAAFCHRIARGQSTPNGKLNEKEIDRFCRLDDEAEETLSQAAGRFALSRRAVANTKKVARTVADLEEAEIITKSHILEALGYRRRA